MKQKNYFQFLKTGWLAIALLFSVSASATIYVKPNAGSTAWSGETTVYTDFEAAYAAAEANENIWVAAGEYPITTILNFKSVNIYGGFAGTETSIDERAKVTNGKAWEFTNASVLKLANTISGTSDATRDAGIFSNGNNAGIGSTTFLVNGITFDGNKSSGYTGRAINIGGHSTTAKADIVNCIVQNFESKADGGGLNLRSAGVTVSYCLIQNNVGNKGGAGYFDRT